MDGFGYRDIIDILLLAFVMYQIYRIVKESGTSVIFKGMLAFLIIWILVSKVLALRMMGAILDTFVNLGILVIIILFQDDIRRFLMNLGSNKTFGFLQKLFKKKGSTLSDQVLTPVVLACINMAKSYTGALIVIEKEMRLGNYISTGEELDADISTRLIENIFFKNTPLHDGAMIIRGDKIKAAGCILPISQDATIPKHFGLRHRAAIGISEETDAMVIVVSEERGKISFVSRGVVEANVSPERLQELLSGNVKTEEAVQQPA